MLIAQRLRWQQLVKILRGYLDSVAPAKSLSVHADVVQTNELIQIGRQQVREQIGARVQGGGQYRPKKPRLYAISYVMSLIERVRMKVGFLESGACRAPRTSRLSTRGYFSGGGFRRCAGSGQ